MMYAIAGLATFICLSCAPAAFDDPVAMCEDFQLGYCALVDWCGVAPVEDCLAAFDARYPCDKVVDVTALWDDCMVVLESDTCPFPFVVPVCDNVLVVQE